MHCSWPVCQKQDGVKPRLVVCASTESKTSITCCLTAQYWRTAEVPVLWSELSVLVEEAKLVRVFLLKSNVTGALTSAKGGPTSPNLRMYNRSEWLLP